MPLLSIHLSPFLLGLKQYFGYKLLGTPMPNHIKVRGRLGGFHAMDSTVVVGGRALYGCQAVSLSDLTDS